MRWGIRRYQNKDGTLTPAGKKRYGEALSKLTPSNFDKCVEIGKNKAGVSRVDANTDIIKRGSSINRYATSNETLDSRRKYASLTNDDRDLYRDQIVLGGIGSDFGEPISLFEYEAKKKLRIASGEKVVNDLIDSYGDSSIREMYDYVHKYRNTVNEMNRRTASKVQKEAASYVEKSSSTLDKFFADAIKLHMDDISNRYSKEKYDGFVDAEDWATKFAEYPIVIINPKESMKLKRKEEVYY